MGPPLSPHGPPEVRVLIVEDDDHAREGMVRLLRTFGLWARGARDGVEARRLVPDVQPDVIFCDLQMPRLDGFGFVSWLRRTPPFHRTLTVAVSGRSGPLDVAATRVAGFDDHLVKPVSWSVIARVLERVVRRLS